MHAHRRGTAAMWNQLFAAAAGLALAAGAASAQPPPADEFRGAIFAPGAVGLPAEGPLLTPGVGGEPAPNVFDPVVAPDPADFVRGPASGPAPDRPWVWGSAEVLLGTGTGARVPTLVTTGPAAAGLLAGGIGQPGTVPLFGGRRMLDDWRAGVRAELGAWFGRDHAWGASARFYSLYSTSEQLAVVAGGPGVINLPQVATLGGVRFQFPVLANFPGVTTGSAFATAQTTFAGGDLNLRRVLHADHRLRFEAFAGYRQLHLGDDLGAAFRTSLAAAPFPLGPALDGEDSVRTRNNFYGAQLGGLGSVARGRWVFQGTAAAALGVNASDLDFGRVRAITVGGLGSLPLVRVAEAGRTDYFGVVAEGGVRVGYRIADHAKLTCGYTALYWWNVRRAQEQYDLSAALGARNTYFLAHMLSGGVEVKY